MATVSRYINYSAIEATNTFHSSPRFGHSNDFADLFSASSNTQSDYVKGVIFAAVLILSFFVVWLLLLMIFKCLGQKVGFLSGGRMLIHRDNESSDGGRRCTRPAMVRGIFCGSTLIVVAFTIVLVTKGLDNLENTTGSLDESNLKVADILIQFQGIATDLRTVGASANRTRDQIVSQLGNFCPANNNNVSQQTVANLEAAGQKTAVLLQTLGDFIDADVANAQKSLLEAQHTTDDVHRVLNKLDFHTIAVTFIVLYIVLPSCIMLGVLMTWCGCFNPCIECMLSWLFLPVWVLLIVVAIVCTSMSSWMVIANADFCSGGHQDTPDATIQQILDFRNVTTSSFLGKVANFYINQCLTIDPWAFLRGYEGNLTSVNETIAGLATNLNQAGLTTLQKVCGRDYTKFLSLLAAMELTLSTLVQDALLALNLLSCDSIVPIYTNTAYGTSCRYSISALAWCFASFLVISFFGMIMITLRSAWHNVKYIEDLPKALEEGPYMERMPLDDEDQQQQQPPVWNSYEQTEPVVEYGDGQRDEEFHHEYQEQHQENDPSSYQEDGDHDVVYHDEPKVVREYGDIQPDDGLYRASAH